MTFAPEKLAKLVALATRHNLDVRPRLGCFDLVTSSRLAWIRTDLSNPCELRTRIRTGRYAAGRTVADVTSDLAYLEPIMAEVDEQLSDLPW